MAQLSLPIRKDTDVSRTNIYFRKTIKGAAMKAARDRYGISLSRLVNELVARELSLKGGILLAKLAEPGRGRKGAHA